MTADPGLPVPPTGYGGIERIVDSLVRHYRSQGDDVGILADAKSSSPANVRFAWPARSARGVSATMRNALALRAAADAFRPDVLHSFSRLAYLAPLLARKLPKIMSYQRHTGGRQIAIAARLAGDSLRFTGCSEFICAMGRRAGGQWHAIPNFVEPEKISFTSTVPADAPLLFLSRIESIKGPDLAIEIARRSRRRLILAGNHAEEGHEGVFWETKITPHIGRDGIEYAGEVDDAQKNALLGSAAALLVPIQWDEPFGIVFAEALAAGTPVITCARGALPEIITPGETGFFIEGADDGASAVHRIGEIDRATCRRRAETHFSVAVCGAQYLDLYRGMLLAHRS